MKKNKLSEGLLQYLRANLIFSYRKDRGTASNNYLNDLLVSSPVDNEFELYIVEQGIGLVENLL